MNSQTTLLIATTNPGKIREFREFFKHQPISCVFLTDLADCPPEPAETGETFVDNAVLKAKYYGQKTGLLTMADDSGLSVEALGGWPGVISARVAPTSEERTQLVLEKLAGVPDDKRTAAFHIAIAIYNPQERTTLVAEAKADGRIATAPTGSNGFGYDPIFYSPTLGKTFGEASIEEKSTVSHRAKAMNSIKYLLKNNFGVRDVVVPVALIVQNSKLLMNLRNDPHHAAYHNTWEFPGGGVEWGEPLADCVVREAKEETGLDVEIIAPVGYIKTEAVERPDIAVRYQLYLVPYVCRVVGGTLSANPDEALRSEWFSLDDVLSHQLTGTNDELYRSIRPALEKIIVSNHL